jgi:hypothetical protein
MIRLVASCIWVMAVTSASAYLAATWPIGDGQKLAAEKPGELERKKTAAINVPMITGGHIEGYIVAQFIYLADQKILQTLSLAPDDFVSDEAFRELYSSDIDFNHLEKYDLQTLTRRLIQKVNDRLGLDIIKDILVAEFTYVPKSDISK